MLLVTGTVNSNTRHSGGLIFYKVFLATQDLICYSKFTQITFDHLQKDLFIKSVFQFRSPNIRADNPMKRTRQRTVKRILFTVPVTSNASRHLKSPLAMGEMPFKIKRASSVPISVVIDTGVNSNEQDTD